MKSRKKQPLEIELIKLLGKPTLTLIRKFGKPVEKVRQRSSHFYFYSNRDKEIIFEVISNKSLNTYK